MRVAMLLGLALLSACGQVQEQSNLAKPAAVGKPYVAGTGDIVMDLRQTQSLPNAMGRADMFGRTRDAGRVTVRFLGIDRGQAIFARQDVALQSNETTMSRSPIAVPTYQTSSGSGNIGNLQVAGSSSTYGVAYLPPASSSTYPIQAGQVQLSAPVGGSVLVEGHRINVLRAVDGGIEYSVN